MKKFIITMMVVFLAITSVFAIEGFKVGAEAGYVSYGITFKAEDVKTSINVGGFKFSGVAEYQVIDNVDVVAKLGLNVYGKPLSRITIGDTTIENVGGEAVPVHFTAYVGGKYTYAINDKFAASAGLGLDFMLGKLDKDTEKPGIFLGAKADLTGKYKINDKLAVTLGGGFTWFFVDTADELSEIKKDTKDAGGSYFERGVVVTAGVTYSL